MISSSSNPSGEIREAALEGPEVWLCLSAKFKGGRKKKNKSTTLARAWPRGAPLDAFFSSSLCRQVRQTAPKAAGHSPSGDPSWGSGKASRKKSGASVAKTELWFCSRKGTNTHLESNVQLSQLNPEPKLPCFGKVRA